MHRRLRSASFAASLLVLALATAFLSAAADPGADLARGLAPLEPWAASGVLYDRVLPLARLERFDGSAGAPACDRATWRQAYDELRRATFPTSTAPAAEALDRAARALARERVVPLALIDRGFERIRPGAIADGAVTIAGDRAVATGEAPLERRQATLAAAFAPRTYRGGEVTFALERSLCITDDPLGPRSIAIDFADGAGYRPVAPGERVRVRYATPGPRTIAFRLARSDGSVAEAHAAFDVVTLAAPLPNDTLHVTASVAYQGQFGAGDAYVYLAPGHASVVNPVVVAEGFDLDNSMDWDELYALLNGQGLLESLRADGFDAIVLNFTDSTNPIETNGLVVAELLQQVGATIAPSSTIALVGASMGGLCSRYALLWLESHAIPHRVRTWVSFDSPQKGANIPLGLQYWINFFSGQSTSAAAFLAALQRPASREMLLYHFTTPAGTTGRADALFDTLQAHFAALGGWPQFTRRVAIANGSGDRDDQGFAPGAQVIQYAYSDLLVALRGHVWAVPNGTGTKIFDGSLRILFSTTSQAVTVSGTLPWDGAPGGSRASFTQLDTTAAPYGDIVALHPSHAFIPTVSALALATSDPFFDVAGAPNLAALTPFDAVYFPLANEEHVQLTPANAAWVRNEIEQGVVGVADGAPAPASLRLSAVVPNPFRASARLAFTLPRAGAARLSIYDLAGREVRRLADGRVDAGAHEAGWDGRDARGARVPAGLYFARLDDGETVTSARLVRLD